jgi:hypothetical protein
MLSDRESSGAMPSLKLFRRRPISEQVSTVQPHAPLEDSNGPPPDVLLERVAVLVRERQSLRARGAGRAELERNRMQITRAQWDLSRALIARYTPAV